LRLLSIAQNGWFNILSRVDADDDACDETDEGTRYRLRWELSVVPGLGGSSTCDGNM
jgi:hypothetical protein